jgi:hypothetical protein
MSPKPRALSSAKRQLFMIFSGVPPIVVVLAAASADEGDLIA